MGLGAQLLLWRNGFCEHLVNRGYRVIRYDNRDVGLSGKLDGQWAGGYQEDRPVLSRRSSPSVYRLEDMADDAAALLNHLRSTGAHRRRVDGRHDRADLRGQPSIPHSSAGNHLLLQQLCLPAAASPQGVAVAGPRPGPDASREAVIDNIIRVGKIIESPAYPVTEEKRRADATESYERAYYPQGVARHFGAVLGSGSLKRYNRQITAPTVVIHGLADKLMRPAGGRAIARSIPNARLVLFDGSHTICPKLCGVTSSANCTRRSPKVPSPEPNSRHHGSDAKNPARGAGFFGNTQMPRAATDP